MRGPACASMASTNATSSCEVTASRLVPERCAFGFVVVRPARSISVADAWAEREVMVPATCCPPLGARGALACAAVGGVGDVGFDRACARLCGEPPAGGAMSMISAASVAGAGAEGAVSAEAAVR